jgi:hypothetical protein
MDSMTLVTAAAAGLGALLGSSLLRRKSAKLAPLITPLLLDRGPMTLPALQEALGKTSFSDRGKIAMALNELASAGTVEIVPAPAGTPQMQKVNAIVYKLRAA